MDVEVCAPAEPFPTAVAPVGLLARVDGQMRIKMRALVKTLPTLRAGKGLLSRVNSLVRLQI